MEGDENISLQRAEGGNGLAGGIKKKKPKRKGQRSRSTQVPARRSDKMANDRAGHARHEGPVLPSRDVNRIQKRAGFRPRALRSTSRFLSPNPLSPSLSLFLSLSLSLILFDIY